MSFGIGDERVGVRAAAGLHRGHLAGLAHVADVEDADAAEAFAADRRFDAAGAAVDPAARLLDRHDQQVAVNRDVALPARADHRGDQPRVLRVLDVVGIEAVEVAGEQVLALERQVGVGEVQPARSRGRRRLGGRLVASGSSSSFDRPVRSFSGGVGSPAGDVRIEEAGRLRQRGDELEVPRRLARVAQAGLQADPRIGRPAPAAR